VKDKFIMGMITGLLANIIRLGVDYAAFRFKFTQVVAWRWVATRFLQGEDIHKPVALLLGAVADLAVSWALGIAFILLISVTGADYLWLKGIGLALVTWVGLFGTILHQHVLTTLAMNPSDSVVTLVTHLAFGISLAFFTRKLWLRQLADPGKT